MCQLRPNNNDITEGLISSYYNLIRKIFKKKRATLFEYYYNPNTFVIIVQVIIWKPPNVSPPSSSPEISRDLLFLCNGGWIMFVGSCSTCRYHPSAMPCFFFFSQSSHNGCLSTRQLVLPRHSRLFPHFPMSLDFRMEILIITQSVGVLINSRWETSWKAGCAARLNSLKCQLMAGGIINDSWRGECREMTSASYPLAHLMADPLVRLQLRLVWLSLWRTIRDQIPWDSMEHC